MNISIMLDSLQMQNYDTKMMSDRLNFPSSNYARADSRASKGAF